MDISQLTAYTNRVINDGEITRDEAKELLTFNDEDTPLLLAMADKIRRFFRGNDVDCCAIVGGRSGRCPEDCRFCAQSCHYNTGIKAYPLIDTDKMIEAAKKAKAAGATRFSIVTGGRAVEEGTDFNTILQAVPVIRNTVGIEVCCSLGFISENQLLALKKAGITSKRRRLISRIFAALIPLPTKKLWSKRSKKQVCAPVAAVFSALANRLSSDWKWPSSSKTWALILFPSIFSTPSKVHLSKKPSLLHLGKFCAFSQSSASYYRMRKFALPAAGKSISVPCRHMLSQPVRTGL